MGKKSAPAPPDYVGAAQQTSAGDLAAARASATSNRVSQYTPYGNVVYSNNVNGNPDQWRADVSLAPTQQALLDAQNKTSLGLAGLQDKGLSYVSDMLQHPFDTSSLPKLGVDPGQTYQDAVMSRLQPQLATERSQLNTQLANQGIAVGSDAYNNAMRSQNQRENDMLTSAVIGGIQNQDAARSQAFQEQSYLRNEPINTLNAVRTGSQVNMPTFQSVPQQGQTKGADYTSAANSSYGAALDAANAKNAQAAGNTQAGVGLASLLAYALMA